MPTQQNRPETHPLLHMRSPKEKSFKANLLAGHKTLLLARQAGDGPHTASRLLPDFTAGQLSHPVSRASLPDRRVERLRQSQWLRDPRGSTATARVVTLVDATDSLSAGRERTTRPRTFRTTDSRTKQVVAPAAPKTAWVRPPTARSSIRLVDVTQALRGTLQLHYFRRTLQTSLAAFGAHGSSSATGNFISTQQSSGRLQAPVSACQGQRAPPVP